MSIPIDALLLKDKIKGDIKVALSPRYFIKLLGFNLVNQTGNPIQLEFEWDKFGQIMEIRIKKDE